MLNLPIDEHYSATLLARFRIMKSVAVEVSVVKHLALNQAFIGLFCKEIPILIDIFTR